MQHHGPPPRHEKSRLGPAFLVVSAGWLGVGRARGAVLRTEAQRAKNSVRDALKERLNENGDIDFVGEGDRIRVFRVFRKQQARRTRSLDLSSSFREQPLEGKAETNGHCGNAGVADETEEATPNLNPEEAAASLDPVTERLMTLMREKGQR